MHIDDLNRTPPPPPPGPETNPLPAPSSQANRVLTALFTILIVTLGAAFFVGLYQDIAQWAYDVGSDIFPN